jgi:hypothetical protein
LRESLVSEASPINDVLPALDFIAPVSKFEFDLRNIELTTSVVEMAEAPMIHLCVPAADTVAAVPKPVPLNVL